LLANLTSVHLKAPECVFLEKYVLLKESMPQELRGASPAQPPKSFWEQHYYAVLFEKFGKEDDMFGSSGEGHASGMSGAGGPGDAQDGPGTGMGDGFSDEERAAGVGGASRASQGQDVGTVGMDAVLGGSVYSGDAVQEVEFDWVGALSVMEETQCGTHHKFEGWVIECDEGMHPVRSNQVKASSQKRGLKEGDSDGGQTIGALGCLLADKQGPVIGCFWDDEAKELLRVVTTMRGRVNRPLVLLKGLRIAAAKESAWNGKRLTPYEEHTFNSRRWYPDRNKDFDTFDGVVTVHDKCRLSGTAFQLSSQFERARSALLAPPFRGSFTGTVANTRDLDSTVQGKAKLCFELLDNDGIAIQFFGIGRNANAAVIKNGVQVEAYNGTGREGRGSAEGGVYLFKDAMVVPLCNRAVPVQRVRCIQI
jgi:hypothetical protein